MTQKYDNGEEVKKMLKIVKKKLIFSKQLQQRISNTDSFIFVTFIRYPNCN